MPSPYWPQGAVDYKENKLCKTVNLLRTHVRSSLEQYPLILQAHVRRVSGPDPTKRHDRSPVRYHSAGDRPMPAHRKAQAHLRRLTLRMQPCG